MFAATFESEVETKHFGIARRKRRQRELDLVGEEAIHRLLLGVGHFVRDKPLDERPVALGIHGRVQPNVAGVQRRQGLHHVDRKSGELLGSRRSFCRRISDALMMRERSAVRLSGTRTVRPWRASEERIA